MIGDNGQLFGWSEQTWLWLSQAGTLLGNILMILSMLATVWAFFKREHIRRWFRRNRFPDIGETLQETTGRWDGLIFTISKPELPKWVIQQIRPKAVALLASKASRKNADDIMAYCESRHIEVFGPFMIHDASDPAESREQTILASQKLKHKGCQHLAVDITGGLTPMSLGAFMAAEEQGLPSLYVSSEYDDSLKQPIMSTAQLRCISRPAQG